VATTLFDAAELADHGAEIADIYFDNDSRRILLLKQPSFPKWISEYRLGNKQFIQQVVIREDSSELGLDQPEGITMKDDDSGFFIVGERAEYNYFE
jgi:hypothetical protein